MSAQERVSGWTGETLTNECMAARGNFSAYLDGALDGGSMAQLAQHFERCDACDEEFKAWRSVHAALAELGQAEAPEALQAQLRYTLAGELELGTYRSPMHRLVKSLRFTLMPAALRLSAGLAAAMLLVGCLSWVIGSVAPVQANDDRMAHLNAPQYLYSVAPPEPITTASGFVAVLVDAKVNAEGRVYDYDLIEGPRDTATRARIEENLLGSIFKPATVFGVPVPGHAMMTYTAVSVRG